MYLGRMRQPIRIRNSGRHCIDGPDEQHQQQVKQKLCGACKYYTADNGSCDHGPKSDRRNNDDQEQHRFDYCAAVDLLPADRSRNRLSKTGNETCAHNCRCQQSHSPGPEPAAVNRIGWQKVRRHSHQPRKRHPGQHCRPAEKPQHGNGIRPIRSRVARKDLAYRREPRERHHTPRPNQESKFSCHSRIPSSRMH